MKYNICKGERAFALWLINNIKGVNRTDGRLASNVIENLELDSVRSVPVEALSHSANFELSELEGKWILDNINTAFDKQSVPPSLAKHALSLEDNIKDAPVVKAES